MSPSFAMDMSDDFTMPTSTSTATPTQPQFQPQSTPRTLLLSPPSLSSHQEKLTQIMAMHDRKSTDFQMLDRLNLGLVSLPESTYDVITVLSDADNSLRESQTLLGRKVFEILVKALRTGGILKSQDGQLGSQEGPEKNEAILAGLTFEQGKQGFVKQDFSQVSVPLKFGRKNGSKNVSTTTNGNATTNGNGTAAAAGGLADSDNTGSVSLPLNSKRKSADMSSALPAGVGFDDGALNDLDDIDSDDELIDEDTLLDEDDFRGPIKIPTACAPKAKRRRACKDCTCGLAQRLDAEDKAKREKADAALSSIKLNADDLAEVDFTVEGKVGSCGNCSLGDAFRCDGCPYIGLPAFKVGEEVRLMGEDIQL